MLEAILGLAGVLLILTALVGGGFSFSGSIFPRIGRMARIPCFAVGTLLLCLSLILAIPKLTSEAPPTAAPQPEGTTSSSPAVTSVPLDPDISLPLGEVVEAIAIYQEPYLDAQVTGRLEPGAIIEILCTAYGDSVTHVPSGMSSSLWNGVSGGYVPDVAVYTGTNEPTIGEC